MLLAAMVTLIIGYSMVYSALHGSWAFWQFWFPAKQVPANT
jgi:hypothetical protein